MFEAKFKAKDYSAAPADVELRSLLGGLMVGDWMQTFIARGFGWHVDVGAFSTGVVGGGNGTVFDQDQPELVVEAAAGYTLVPLRIAVACHTPLLATDADESEILIAVDRTQVIGATATNGTVETPLNLRTDRVGGCPLTVTSACTVNTTNPTLSIELARAVKTGDLNGTPANALWGDLSLVYEPLRPPFIVGPATLLVYFGGTVATPGFIQADFLAIPSGLLTGLA